MRGSSTIADASALDFTVLLRQGVDIDTILERDEQTMLLDERVSSSFRLVEDSFGAGLTPMPPSRKRPRASLNLTSAKKPTQESPRPQLASVDLTAPVQDASKKKRSKADHILPQSHPAHARPSQLPVPVLKTVHSSIIPSYDAEEDFWAVSPPRTSLTSQRPKSPEVYEYVPTKAAQREERERHQEREQAAQEKKRRRASRAAAPSEGGPPKRRVSNKIAEKAHLLKVAFLSHAPAAAASSSARPSLPAPARVPLAPTAAGSSTGVPTSTKSNTERGGETITKPVPPAKAGGLTLMHEFEFSNRPAEREMERQRREQEREREIERRAAEAIKQAHQESALARMNAVVPPPKPITLADIRPFSFATDARIQVHYDRQHDTSTADRATFVPGRVLLVSSAATTTTVTAAAAATKVLSARTADWHERQKKREAQVRARREQMMKDEQAGERDKLVKLRQALASRDKNAKASILR